MSDKKNSRYSYSVGQKELNRALKMQEKELQELEKQSNALSSSIAENDDAIAQTHNDVEDLIKETETFLAQVKQIASDRGVDLPEHLKSPIKMRVEKPSISERPFLADEKISVNDIPSWEKVMKKTNEKVPEEVVLEELLSAKEFQYCIEDVKRINEEFAKKTKLNKTDNIFLIIATALQTARWIIIQLLMGELGETVNTDERISDKEGDKQKKKDIHDWNKNHDEHENIESIKGYPTWKEILFGKYNKIDGTGKSSGNCPYDAQTNAPIGFDSSNKGNHRVYTLGHDPILGWIFGTANIMTCTISLTKEFNFATHRVLYPGACFGDKIPMSLMFNEMYESICEDKFRLAAGLFAQYAHLKSDKFTKRGLPVPVIEAFSKELTGKLYSEQYDSLCLVRDMKIVGAQAGLSILINMIIGFVHGLYYNANIDGRREHYEVRTRKILLYSNAISSSINSAYVAANAAAGNEGEALKKLDLGGILVSLWRLFSDVRFITRVKEQFIEEELDKVTKDSLEKLESMFKQ